LSMWDFANMFFPKVTNGKQFDCAFKFLKELDKEGVMSNTEVRRIFESPKEQVLLMSHVMPKLQKFGLVKTGANGSPRKYNLTFDKTFTYLLRDTSTDWLVFYARHTNERKQLEGNTL